MAHILLFSSDYKGSLGNWISTWPLRLRCHLGGSGDLLNSFLKHGCSTYVTTAVVGIQGDEASIPVQLWSFRITRLLFQAPCFAQPSSIFFQTIFMLPFQCSAPYLWWRWQEWSESWKLLPFPTSGYSMLLFPRISLAFSLHPVWEIMGKSFLGSLSYSRC